MEINESLKKNRSRGSQNSGKRKSKMKVPLYDSHAEMEHHDTGKATLVDICDGPAEQTSSLNFADQGDITEIGFPDSAHNRNKKKRPGIVGHDMRPNQKSISKSSRLFFQKGESFRHSLIFFEAKERTLMGVNF